MSSGIASSLSDSQRLTLLHLMGMIATFALAFAFLPMALCVGLTIAVALTCISVLVYDGLHLPVVTDGEGARRWLPWVVWSLALVVCPVMIYVVASLHKHTGPPAFGGPQPWAYHVVQRLCLAHFHVSVIAWIAVVVLTRGYPRWFAWGAILAIVASTCLLTVGASMYTTGIAL